MSIRDERFSFIEDEQLRRNLTTVFIDIIDFISLMESFDESMQVNIRRAIVLYTAAIIEALLFCLIKKKAPTLEYSDDEEWRYASISVFHRYQDGEGKNIEIIGGKRHKKKKKIGKTTPFKELNRFARRQEYISQELSEQIDSVRLMRNKIHLSQLAYDEKSYTQEDLNCIFETARIMTNVVEQAINT